MSERTEHPILSLLPAKRFHSCVLTTYSFDFNYFNHDALAGIYRSGVRNICVLLDDSMLQQYLGCLSGYSAGAAKRYSISSIVRSGAFHPKLSLFFGRDGHGFLIIGSGNLTAAGHGSNQELWGAFHIDGPNDPKAPLFKQTWEYVKNLGAETPGMSQRKLVWIETHTPWLQDIPAPQENAGYDIGKGIEAFFLTNRESGILSDLRKIVRNEVRECTVISPFFDNKTAALLELESMYPNARIHVFVQPDTVTGDLMGKKFDHTSFYDWNALINVKRQRYLHAKWLHIQTSDAEYCLFGSANLTAPALGTSRIKPSNEEACLLLKRTTGGNWLEELGLNEKGIPIQLEDIGNRQIEATEDNHDKEAQQYRLLAIDRISNSLHVYSEPQPDFQKTNLALFDGWGGRRISLALTSAESISDGGFLRISAGSIPEDVLYGQLFNSDGQVVSNKQIIHDMAALSRTNPDPNTQRMEEVLDRIEFADAEMVEILNYLNPDDLTDERLPGGCASSNDECKQKTKSDGTGETLSYDDFTKVSLDYQYKGGMPYLYGTHRIERILETLRTIFEKLKIRDIDMSGQDEEADKNALEKSTGRTDEDPPSKNEPPQSKSAFDDLQKTVFRFFNQYITILDKQRKKKHQVNVLDSSMFTIALHLLIDFLDKPIQVKKKNDGEVYEEILLIAEGEYFEKQDYCRIVAEIIGKFTMILINGIDYANDEYVRRRIEKCQRMAYWHALSCIARLVPCESKAEELWKWELGMNLRHFYDPTNSNNEITAREEFEHRIQMMTCSNSSEMISRCMNVWQEIEGEYSKYLAHQFQYSQKYTSKARIFCELTGFSHIYRVAASGKYHHVWLARPGYNPSIEDWDFKENQIIRAEIAQAMVLE
jgi:hypothetical protein